MSLYSLGKPDIIVEYVVSISSNIAINRPVMCIPIKDVAQKIGFKISISKDLLSMMDIALRTS